MVDATPSIDDQIKQADLEIKKRELTLSPWRKHPVVIAAVISGLLAIGAAVSTAAGTLISSSIQAQTEQKKIKLQTELEREKYEAELSAENAAPWPLSTLNGGEMMSELRMFLDAGLLRDNTGSLRKILEPTSSH